MPYARPFTHTTSVAPQYTESAGQPSSKLYISAPETNEVSGIFATYGSLSGYEWWNGPDESLGYVIGRSVTGFTHSTPNGNVGNVKFWRTDTITDTEFITLGSRILGFSYSTDTDVYDSLTTGADGDYWTSYQYSIFIGGDFTTYMTQSHTRFAVIRKTDGELDPHVGSRYDFFEPGFENKVFHIHHRSNGKMLVSGSFTQSIGTTQSYLVQIGTDGLPDGIIRSFNGEIYQTISNTHRGFEIGTVGTSTIDIIAVGSFTSYDGNTRNRIVAINSDGSTNAQFANNGFDDTVFTIDSSRNLIFVGGNFLNYDGNGCDYLVALDIDDGTLNSNIGGVVGLDGGVNRIKLSKNLRYLAVCGAFTIPYAGFFLYDNQNTQEVSGFSNFDLETTCVDFQSNGSLIIGGKFTQYGSNGCNKICKLDPTGGFNTTFGTNIGNGFNGNVLDLRVLHDDSIIVVGDFTDFDGNTANRIVKLDSNGNLITDWNGTISTGADGAIQCVAPR